MSIDHQIYSKILSTILIDFVSMWSYTLSVDARDNETRKGDKTMCETITKAKRQPKVDPSTIKTYWNGEVITVTSEGRDRTLVSSGDKTLALTLSRLFADATYYLSIGYTNIRLDGIEQKCELCYGGGSKMKRAYGKSVRCPECKGIGTFAKIDAIPIVVPESGVKITNDCI